jgi:hypothetical protein
MLILSLISLALARTAPLRGAKGVGEIISLQTWREERKARREERKRRERETPL